MKKNPFRTIPSILAIVAGVLAVGMVFAYATTSFAFNGPSQPPPSGYGAIGSDASNNVGVGTSTTISGTKLAVVGASSDNTTYAAQFLKNNSTPIFILRDDGSVSIETSTISVGNTVIGGNLTVGGTFAASTFGGSITAGNVTAGQFGSNFGWGTFSFLGNVGIGTTTPSQMLSVGASNQFTVDSSGNFSSTGYGKYNTVIPSSGHFYCINYTQTNCTTYSGGAGFMFDVQNQIWGGTFGAGGSFTIQGNSPQNSTTGGFVFFGGSTRGDAQQSQAYMGSNSTGNPGVGSATGVLVDGTAGGHNQNYVGVGYTAGSIVPVQFSVNGSSYFGGNVGIGTTAPTTALTVVGNISSTALCLGGTCNTTWPSGGGVTSVFGRTGAVVAASGDYSVGQITGAAPIASPTFTGVVTAPSFVGNLNASNVTSGEFAGGNYYFPANVGIGTTNPLALLDLGNTLGIKELVYGSGGTPGYQMGFGLNLGQLPNELSFIMPFQAQTISGIGFDSPNQTWPYTSYTTRMVILSSGNVGIGTTAPNSLLNVNGNIDVPAGSFISSGASAGSNGSININFTGGIGNLAAPGANLSLQSGWAQLINMVAGTGGFQFQTDNGSGTNTTNMTILQNGNVGIGTTAPGSAKLMVVGMTSIQGQANIGENTNGTAVIDAYSSYAYFGDNSPTNGIAVGSNGSVTISGPKLTVGTIDPLYTIGGTNYSTYTPGMTGENEETAGTLDLQKNADGTYSLAINFATAAKGSNFWLFAQATNLANTMSQLVVSLTPSFDGNVWYTKNASADTLTLHGSAAGEVSYNLTAPRFDAAQWPNLAPADESSTTGLIIK